MTQLDALTFSDARDLHKRLGQVNPALARMTLPEFSDFMNKRTGTQAFDAGKTDNWFMRISAGIDDALEFTQLPQIFGDAGAAVGSAFGMEKLGRELGRGTPRGFLDMAPAFIPGLGWIGLVATGAMTALDTYEKTGGNVPAALISGTTAGATVPVARAAGQAMLGRMGAPVVEEGFRAATVGQRLAEVGMENVAATALGEVGNQGVSVASGQGLYNPITPENVFQMVAGNIPFAVLDLPQLFSPLAKVKEQPSVMDIIQEGALEKPLNQAAAAKYVAEKAPVANITQVDENGDLVAFGKKLDSEEDAEAVIRQFTAEEPEAKTPEDLIRPPEAIKTEQPLINLNFTKDRPTLLGEIGTKLTEALSNGEEVFFTDMTGKKHKVQSASNGGFETEDGTRFMLAAALNPTSAKVGFSVLRAQRPEPSVTPEPDVETEIADILKEASILDPALATEIELSNMPDVSDVPGLKFYTAEERARADKLIADFNANPQAMADTLGKLKAMGMDTTSLEAQLKATMELKQNKPKAKKRALVTKPKVVKKAIDEAQKKGKDVKKLKKKIVEAQKQDQSALVGLDEKDSARYIELGKKLEEHAHLDMTRDAVLPITIVSNYLKNKADIDEFFALRAKGLAAAGYDVERPYFMANRLGNWTEPGTAQYVSPSLGLAINFTNNSDTARASVKDAIDFANAPEVDKVSVGNRVLQEGATPVSKDIIEIDGKYFNIKDLPIPLLAAMYKVNVFYLPKDLKLAKVGDVVNGKKIETSSFFRRQTGVQDYSMMSQNGPITTKDLADAGYDGVIGNMDGVDGQPELMLIDGAGMKLASPLITDKIVPPDKIGQRNVKDIRYSMPFGTPLDALMSPDLDTKILSARNELDSLTALINLVDVYAGVHPEMDPMEAVRLRMSKFILPGEGKGPMGLVSPQEAVSRAIKSLGFDVELDVLRKRTETLKAEIKSLEEMRAEEDAAAEQALKDRYSFAAKLNPEYASMVALYIKSRAFVALSESAAKEMGLDRMRKVMEDYRKDGNEKKAAAIEQEILLAEGYLSRSEIDNELAMEVDNVPELKDQTLTTAKVDISELTEQVYREAWKAQQAGMKPQDFPRKFSINRAKHEALRMSKATTEEVYGFYDYNTLDADGLPTYVYPAFDTKAEAEVEAEALRETALPGESFVPFQDSGKWKIKRWLNTRQALVEGWDATGDAAQYEPRLGPGYRENLEDYSAAVGDIEGLEGQEILDRVNEYENKIRALTHENVDGGIRLFASAIVARQKKLLATDPRLKETERYEASLIAEAILHPNFWEIGKKGKKRQPNHKFVAELFRQAGLTPKGDDSNIQQWARNTVKRAIKNLEFVTTPNGKDLDPLLERLLGRARNYKAYKQSHSSVSLETFEIQQTVDQFARQATGMMQDGVKISVVENPEDVLKINKKVGQEFLDKGGYAEAFFDPTTQHIVLITKNIVPRPGEGSWEDAGKRVLVHESIGHWGVEKVLGKDFLTVMRKINKTLVTDEERQIIMAQWKIKDPDDIFIAMEFVARRSEEFSKMPWQKRPNSPLGNVVTYIKDFFLGKLGPRVPSQITYRNGKTFSDTDLISLLTAARDHVARKRGFVGLVGAGYNEVGPLEDEPSSLTGGIRRSTSPYWRVNKSYTGLEDAAGNAYETLVRLGVQDGLDLAEAHRKANQVREVFTAYYDINGLRIKRTKITGASPLGGTWAYKPVGNVKQIQADARRHDLAQKMMAQAFNTPPESIVTIARQRAESYLAKASTLERNQWLQALEGELGLPKSDKFESTPDKLLRSMGRVLADGVASGNFKKLEDVLTLAPPELGMFFRGALKELSSINNAALNLHQAETAGVTTRKSINGLEYIAMDRLSELDNVLLKTEQSIERASNVLSKVTSLDPSNFIYALAGFTSGDKTPLNEVATKIRMSVPSAVYREVPLEVPKKPSWLSSFGNLPTNIAERFPEFIPFIRTATGYQAVSQNAISQAYQHLGVEIRGGKAYKNQTFKTFERVAKAPHLRKALSVLARKQNEIVDKIGDELQANGVASRSGYMTPDEIRVLRETDPQLKTLSDTDFQSVMTIFEGLAKANEELAEIILRSTLTKVVNSAAIQLGHKYNWQYMDEIHLCAKEMMQMFTMDRSGMTTPAGALTKPIEARHISSEDFQKVANELAFEQAPAYERFAQFMRGRAGYFPEFRLGKVTVQYLTRDGSLKTVGASDLKEAVKMRAELEASGEAQIGSVTYIEKRSNREDNSVLSKGVLERAQEIEKLAMERLRRVVGNEAYETEILPSYEPLMASIMAEQQRTMQDYMKSRGLAKGREDLDLFLVNMAYIPAVAYGAARSYVKTMGNFFLRDNRLADNLPLKELAKTHLDNVLRPSGSIEKAIKEFAFQYFMALNPSTMAFELLQTTSTLAPWLTRHGSGFGGSYKEILSAISAVTKASRSGTFRDPELDYMTTKAVNEAVISRGLWQEIEDPTGAIESVSDVLRGAGPLEKGRQLGKAYLNLTRNIYGATAYFNSRVAFVAGIKRGQKMGLTGEELYEFGVRTVTATMFTGGKANRQIGLYSGDKGSQPVRAMVGALQGYFSGMVGTMVRSIQDSVDKSLPPTERRAAVKSTIQLLGTQLFYAGALGMPGAAAAAAVLEQMFPELEIKKNLENVPKQMMGDSAVGNWIVDTVLYGVPTASSPLDVSGRIGLGQVLGVNALSGLDATALLGPIGSAAVGVGKSIQSIQQGNPLLAAEQISPVFVKNIIKAIKDDGIIRDYSGNMVGQMSGSERVLQALGFRPKRVGDFIDRQRNMKRVIEIENRREAAYTKELAQELIAGNPAAVIEALQKRKIEEPGFDVENAKRKIARKATDFELPKELGRNLGHAQAAASALQGKPALDARVSETARLMATMQFEGALGVQSSNLNQRMKRAATIDLLVAQNPWMTVDQAKELISQQAQGLSTAMPLTF